MKALYKTIGGPLKLGKLYTVKLVTNKLTDINYKFYEIEEKYYPKSDFDIVKMTVSDETYNGLWLLANYIGQKNVFDYITTRNKEFISLYIALDETGRIDYDSGVNFLDYRTSLDSLKPIALKVISELSVEKENEKALLSDIKEVSFEFNAEKLFEVLVKCVKYLSE